MRLGPKRVFVQFTPTRWELTHPRPGGREPARSELTDPIDSPAKWATALDAFRSRLSAWTDELGLVRTQAVVLYWSPDAAASVHACAASAGLGRARHAAELALTEGVPYDLSANPSDCTFLWRDRRESVTPDGGARPAQVHHLAVADRAANAGAVVEAVRAAGLTPVALVPIAAAGVVAAVAALRERAAESRDGGVHAVAWVGEHQSVLVAGDTNRLLLLRQLSLGTESLVEALARPIRSGDGGTQCVLLDRATARRRLAAFGVPSVDVGSSTADTLDPTLALPLLQPVLQRLALEARNSLRFGLGADDRKGLRLHLAGPGAAIDGLAGVLCTDAGDDASAARTAPSHPPAGEMLAAGVSTGLNLLPRPQLEAMQAQRLRRALWAGVAAATLAVGADTAMTLNATRQADAVLEHLRADASTPDSSREALVRAVSLQQTIDAARARLGHALSDVPEWAAVLAHIADATPACIRLTSLACTREEGTWVCRVNGTAASESGASGVESVRDYVQALAAAPVVSHARLGATQRARIGESEQLAFEVSISLVPLPRGAAPVLHAGAGDDQGAVP